ncbi:la-related protein 6b [Denticeps clupeoides]|uniref:La-related protein 6 n=1 Tax=Denticeps clupeoides TaxID=299321 RepID=A0AAY4D228_9TELE|nr:la-related protein 6-like [Denticeps clupeoides]
MSSPAYMDIFQCGDNILPPSPDFHFSFPCTDDGLNDSLDGSSAELTDVFEEDFCEGDAQSPPVADLVQRITSQLEIYLSNENLAEDAFLLKHVQRNKKGYVSLKLLTSFKKVKELTRDWRTTLAAARASQLLEVNEEGTKVRRRSPVPDWLLCIPTSKLLMAWNFFGNNSGEKEDPVAGEQKDIMETAMRLFCSYGNITSLRVLRPGKEMPSELKRYAKKHPELGRILCAVVEYEYLDGARRAYKALQAEEHGATGLRVVLLGGRGIKKPGVGQENTEEESEETIKSACCKKPNRKAKRYPCPLEDSALYSSSESDFAPASPRPNRRVTRPQALYGSPLAIPRMSSCRADPYRDPLASPIGSPLLPRKLFPCSYASSPLATPQFSSTPTSSGSSAFGRSKGSGDYSQDSAAFVGSPWVQRRKTAAQAFFPEKSAPMSPGGLKRAATVVEVVRQPLGPDGTKGFYNCIGRGKLLLR